MNPGWKFDDFKTQILVSETEIRLESGFLDSLFGGEEEVDVIRTYHGKAWSPDGILIAQCGEMKFQADVVTFLTDAINSCLYGANRTFEIRDEHKANEKWFLEQAGWTPGKVYTAEEVEEIVGKVGTMIGLGLKKE